MASDDSRSQAMAATAATLSDSAAPSRRGIVSREPHWESTSSGRPSRSAPRHSVAAPSSPAGQPAAACAVGRLCARCLCGGRLAAVSDKRHPRRRCMAHVPTRQRLSEDRTHACAHGLGRERIGAVGPEDDRSIDQCVRGTNDRAHIAGIGNPVQIEAEGPCRRSPALRPDGDDPGAGAEVGDLVEQPWIDLLALEAAAGGDQHEARLATGTEAGREQVLALG